MTREQQAIYLNGIPLIALGTIYLAAAASLVPRIVRERPTRAELELPLGLAFACGGAGALLFGVLVLRDREPVGGSAWLVLLGVLVALAPALAFLLRFRDHGLPGTESRRAREADVQLSAREERATARIGAAPAFDDAACVLVEEAVAAVGAEFGALLMTDADGREARGIVGRANGEDVAWLPSLRIDLANETSGVASAYHDAAPFAVYDAANSRRVSRSLVERVGAKSTAFVPLLADRRVVGVLVVATVSQSRAFARDELAMLQRLATDAAVTLERLRAADALAEANERERVVGAIGSRLRTADDVDAVVAVAVAEVGRALGVQRCFVRLLGESQEGAGVVRAEWHSEAVSPVEPEAAARLPASNLAARDRRTVAIDDVASARELADHTLGDRETLLEIGSRAVVATPIVLFDRLLGVLAAHRDEPGPWAPGQVALLEAVAREIAVAITIAQLVEENARRLQRERALSRIASTLGATVALQATRETLVRAAADVYAASSAAMLSPLRGGGFRVVASHAMPAPVAAALETSEEEPAFALSAAERRVLAAPSLQTDERFGHRWRSVAGAASLLLVPLEEPRCDDAALLVVCFEAPREMTDDDLELARHLAGAGRAAIERAELFEAERTSRSLSQQLARTGALLATELDPAAVLDEVVADAPSLVGADACAIWTLDGGDLVVTAASGEDARLAVATRAEAGAWLSGEVVQTRRPVVRDDARKSAPVASDPLLARGYTAYVGVPLVGPEDALYGVLALYGREPRPWRREEVEALQALAAKTSAALSNAELYQRVALEQERSTAILENIADGIVAVDREGSVVLWNKAAEQITGVPASEALGRSPERVLGRTLAAGGAVAIPRGGGDLWLSVTEAVMRDPAGVVSGRIYAFRDISADLLVEQMKTEFVATVSHELRTPLTSIYGFAETLLREDVLFGDEERKVFLRYISSESERLTQTVTALLDVARLESGDLDVTVRPTDVVPVVTDVVTTAAANGGSRRFVLDVPQEPLAAEADAEKLREVLVHLVENAVKHSPDGGTVTVGARRKSDRVEFDVEDEGPGIPEAERERIFRKFYRARSGTGRDTLGGTGTGLFIVQGLVNAMGGRVWVESSEARGSRFAFELPAAGV